MNNDNMSRTDTNSATHWKKQFNYDYLGSHSLDKGQDLLLTIKETKKTVVKGTGGKSQECFVAYFEEDVKPMILNKTNCKTISKVYGTPFIEEWKGLKIIVYAKGGIEAFGDTVEALRIREYIPNDDTLDKIKVLFEKHKKNMDANLVENAQNIINDQNRKAYPKLLTYLTTLK